MRELETLAGYERWLNAMHQDDRAGYSRSHTQDPLANYLGHRLNQLVVISATEIRVGRKAYSHTPLTQTLLWHTDGLGSVKPLTAKVALQLLRRARSQVGVAA